MVSMEQRWEDLASVLLLPPGQSAPPPPGQQMRQSPVGAQTLLPTGFLPETGEWGTGEGLLGGGQGS